MEEMRNAQIYFILTKMEPAQRLQAAQSCIFNQAAVSASTYPDHHHPAVPPWFIQLVLMATRSTPGQTSRLGSRNHRGTAVVNMSSMTPKVFKNNFSYLSNSSRP